MIDGIPQDEFLLGYKVLSFGKVPIDIIDRVEVSRGLHFGVQMHFQQL
jgi:hypothetical protein